MGAQRRASIGETAPDVAFMGDLQPDDAKTFWTEARLFLELAIPTTLLSFGFALSPLLTASYVGLKFGPTFLSAFTLGNLTGNLSTFSLLAGMFSAADTLGPQAFGLGDHREVGLIAIRGIIAALFLVVPINLLLVFNLERLFILAGQDPEASYHAAQWYRIFVCALPFFVFYDAAWKFLSAQHVMKPLIYVSIFSCVVVLPLALEIFTEYYGFLGSAMAYVCFQTVQATLLFLYLAYYKPHKTGSWPGLKAWKEALKYKPMMEYLHLGGGGILSQSEWIYWEALGLMIGNLGVTTLSAHTIPNQVIMINCMVPFSFGTALAIRMGHVLSNSVEHAQHITAGTTVVTTAFFGIISVLLYIHADWIFSFFSTDEEVLDLAHEIWWKVALFNWNVAIFAIFSGVATGLGMQWSIGAINLFFLWGFGIPVTYFFALRNGGGLPTAWTWINVPYTGMNISLILLFMLSDWKKVQEKIHERELEESSMFLKEGAEAPQETQGLMDGIPAEPDYGSRQS